MAGSVFQHRELLFELFKREFAGRYRGSLGGVLWSLAEPLLMLMVYTLAFGVFMQMRWREGGGALDYAFMMFLGLVVYQAFAECLNKAPGLIVAHPNFVKKVIFPLEILPWVMAISALSQCLVALGLWLVGYVVLFGAPHASVLWLPLVLLAFLPSLLAVGWLLAALGVPLRDTGHIAAMLAKALLFMTPVFFSVAAVPDAVRPLLLLNPLTFIIEQLRAVLFMGETPDFVGLLVYFMVSALLAWAARAVFERLRPGFADWI